MSTCRVYARPITKNVVEHIAYRQPRDEISVQVQVKNYVVPPLLKERRCITIVQGILQFHPG